MNKSSFISKRYLKGKRSNLAGSYWLSLNGIIIGVASLLIISSVMNGMNKMVISRILSTKADIQIEVPEGEFDAESLITELEAYDFIDYATPTSAEFLLVIDKDINQLIEFKGIELNDFKENNELFHKISYEEFYTKNSGIILGKTDSSDFNQNGIIIGKELFLQYGYSIGDTLLAISINKKQISSFGMQPLSSQFVIQGVYRNSIPEIEVSLAFVSSKKLQKYLPNNGEYEEIEIYTDSHFKTKHYLSILQRDYPNLNISDWSSKNSNLYSAMKLEKLLMTFVLSLIIMLSSFNLTGSFIKKVSNKKKELGLLSAIGYSKQDLSQIFLYQGLYIGALGVLIGLLVAGIFIFLQAKFQLISIPENVDFLFKYLPVEIKISDFVIIPIFSLTISAISSYLPTLRFRKFNPIDIIRE